MGGSDLHEPVASLSVGGALPGAHQRVVGPRERDAVDEHQLAGVARHVEPLPQAQRAEQAGVRVADELPRQLGQLGLALSQRGQVGKALADRLRRGLGSPAGAEQAQGAAVGGVDQRGDLGQLGLDQAVAPGRGQVTGDVEDRLPGVVERRPDVEAHPGQGVVLARRPARRDRRSSGLAARSGAGPPRWRSRRSHRPASASPRSSPPSCRSAACRASGPTPRAGPRTGVAGCDAVRSLARDRPPRSARGRRARPRRPSARR